MNETVYIPSCPVLVYVTGVFPFIPVPPVPVGDVTLTAHVEGATPVLFKIIVQRTGETKFNVNVIVPPAAQL